MRYNDIRRQTKQVTVGSVKIGKDAPIAIQSMTNTDTHAVEETAAQINALQRAGCDIVRFTVPDMEAANLVERYKMLCPSVPLVADIHFDYRLAIRCAQAGIDKIRINPGNIGEDDHVKEVCRVCKEKNVPIRIGVNSGSLEKHILAKYGSPVPQALAESALYHVALLEKNDFSDIIISVKASNVHDMILANQLLAEKVPYPLHLGVTEAGSEKNGLVKSAAGIGALLAQGIGDTIRVSLTADPLREAAAAKTILQALEMEGQCGMKIVSCPTCGRTKVDLIPLVKQFEDAVASAGLDSLPIKVALMGCVVNGPGEAREADIGIAGGKGEAVLFKKGEICGKIDEKDIINVLIREIKSMNKVQ